MVSECVSQAREKERVWCETCPRNWKFVLIGIPNWLKSPAQKKCLYLKCLSVWEKQQFKLRFFSICTYRSRNQILICSEYQFMCILFIHNVFKQKKWFNFIWFQTVFRRTYQTLLSNTHTYNCEFVMVLRCWNCNNHHNLTVSLFFIIILSVTQFVCYTLNFDLRPIIFSSCYPFFWGACHSDAEKDWLD